MELFEYKGYAIPVHLVNLTGAGPETFDAIARQHMDELRRYIPIAPDHHVLEIGCGIGRDAIPLTEILSERGRYLGVDIIGDSIAWCQEHITPRHPHFRFVHFDVKSQVHNPDGTLRTQDMRLPLENGAVDRIILQSVFTHNFEPDVVHLMGEFRRVLAPSGLVMATFFLVDDEILEHINPVGAPRTPAYAGLTFRHRYGDGCYITDPRYPEGAVAYTTQALDRMLKHGGLQLAQPIHFGAWSERHKEAPDGQDVVVMKKWEPSAAEPLAARYDADYYDHCCGAPYERDGSIWDHFHAIAEQIVSVIAPRTVLDAGCAKGFLVEWLRKRGVEAWGFDVSEYAIGEVTPEIRPYCRVASVAEPLDRDYDLIVCQEVLEHIPAEDARKAIRNLCSHTSDILFSSCPTDYTEPTHINVHPPEFWAEQFARHGFFRDFDFDATFITAWAVRFRKGDRSAGELVVPYEKRLWRLQQEGASKDAQIQQMKDDLWQKEVQVAAMTHARPVAAQAPQPRGTLRPQTFEGKREPTRPPSHDRRVAGASAAEFVLKGPFHPGWYSLRFRGRSLGDGPRELVRFTATDGQDRFDPLGATFYAPLPRPGESERVELTIHLPTVAASIRVLLPQGGEARLWGLRLRRKSRVARVWRLLWAGADRFARSPRRFLRDLERYLSRPGASDHPSSELSQPAELLPYVNPLNMQAVAGRPPRLNVVLPGLVMWAMSGGPNTVINLTYRLARLGVPVRYISSDVPMEADTDRLWEHFRHVTGIDERLENVEMVSAHDRSRATLIGEDDVFFGTAWWTVQAMRGAMRRTRRPRFLYMIQDFEPGLYPWSTAYALAMETYGMDFRGIICGRLLAEHLCREQVGRFADGPFIESCAVFEPAVDRGNFYPDFSACASRPKRLVFYARPGAPRNLYELGLAALKRAAERDLFPPDQWEVLLMGEPQPSIDLGHGVVARALPWCDYRAYGRLLRESDVGLSLMLSPHSSYPPLEIAACGALAVTNVFGVKTAARLREISGNIIPVEPAVEAVTEGLIAAVAQVPDLERRRSQSRLSVPESWEAAFAPILPKVLDMWNDCLKSGRK